MHAEDKPSQAPTENILLPSITRADLEKCWIGLGVALDWIVHRGQPVSAQLWNARDDDAAEALVAVLADLPPLIAEAMVRGVAEGEAGPLVSIPSGVWRQTATSDANDDGQPYRLIGTDDDCEWEGAIRGTHVDGYRRVQIRADFIMENWPEHTMDTQPLPIRRTVKQAEVKRLVEKIASLALDDLRLLTQSEMIDLARGCMPAASRDLIRKYYKDLWPHVKSGPKGPRNPDRKLRIQELRGKLIAAQLHNLD